MNIVKALKNNRVLKSLTGLNITGFQKLSLTFENILAEEKKNHSLERVREVGGGRVGRLKDAQEKLFYMLFYYKVYPTYDVAGFLFDVDKSQAWHWVAKFQQILKKTLGRELVLPARKITTPEEFFKLYSDSKEVFIDGFERKCQRPKRAKAQKRKYSGKKKTHTRKNIVITNEKREIKVLTKSKNGKIHDKKMLDKSDILSNISAEHTLWVDKGFRGIAKLTKARVMMPKFNSKQNPLTTEEKQNNTIISSIRMCVEHAIGGIKRFGIMANTLRGKVFNDDLATELCAGLWNYHIKTSK